MRKMARRIAAHWNKIVFLYALQLSSSHVVRAVDVQLIAPHYVKFHDTATLFCNHSVPEKHLHKIEFMKEDKKIFQYISERKPPYLQSTVDGANIEYSLNGTTIKLKDIGFEASGSYSCAVSTTSPIYTKASDNIQMKVIVPQTENPKITFEKSAYVIGENLEANCSSSAARPVPHLTWFINGKEVDVTLVNDYPHTHYKDNLMSATAKLMVEVSALHAGENGFLEISCHSTIPDYPKHHEQYADIRKHTVTVQIVPAPLPTSSAVMRNAWDLALATVLCIACATRKIIS